MPFDTDGNLVSINLWQRATTTVRERYQRTALAQYGAGLHTDCDDCATEPADVEVPAPRRAVVADEHTRASTV